MTSPNHLNIYLFICVTENGTHNIVDASQMLYNRATPSAPPQFYLDSGTELMSLVYTSAYQLNPATRTHFKDIYPHYCKAHQR